MSVTATELKNRLSETMERAQQEPVVVEKNGRPYAVIISKKEFDYYQALDDRYWGERALSASESGDYLDGVEALKELGVLSQGAA